MDSPPSQFTFNLIFLNDPDPTSPLDLLALLDNREVRQIVSDSLNSRLRVNKEVGVGYLRDAIKVIQHLGRHNFCLKNTAIIEKFIRLFDTQLLNGSFACLRLANHLRKVEDFVVRAKAFDVVTSIIKPI